MLANFFAHQKASRWSNHRGDWINFHNLGKVFSLQDDKLSSICYNFCKLVGPIKVGRWCHQATSIDSTDQVTSRKISCKPSQKIIEEEQIHVICLIYSCINARRSSSSASTAIEFKQFAGCAILSSVCCFYIRSALASHYQRAEQRSRRW